MENPDLSLTVWAKTLTAQQRAAEKEPTRRTVAEWRSVIKAERDAGHIVVSPSDAAGQPRGTTLSMADILKLLPKGGATVFAHHDIDGNLLPATTGWASAMAGTELKSQKAEQAGDDRAVRLRKTQQLYWYRDLFPLLDEMGVCIGTWFSETTRQYEINITLLFWLQELAERFGLRHAQEAIFQIVGEILILIGGDGNTQWEEPEPNIRWPDVPPLLP